MRNYRLVRKLGTGAFGDIFLAVSTNKETEKLAAKLEAITAKHPQLQLEAKLYRLLNEEPCVGFPKVRSVVSCRCMGTPVKTATTLCS
jgi:casein kinase I family protein HRR25